MRFAVTGLGLMTSVGRDAPTACASIRAGIQRPHELTHFFVLDGAEQTTVPLMGRPVAGYTDGFAGIGLWLRLALAALQDLHSQAQLPNSNDAGFWSNTALFVVTPELAAGRFDDDEEISAGQLSSSYTDELIRILGWPISRDLRGQISTGRTGTMEAIARSERLLRGGVERVIVVCADSLLDGLSLAWLADGDRLKSDDNPFGVIPGEAGACFILESESSAAQRGAPILSLITSCHIADSETRPLADDPIVGAALARAFAAILSTEQLETFDGICICDVNGEPWRSQDWGAARARLGGKLGDGVRWLFPAESLGDTGCAGAAIAVCIGSRALHRGYADSDAVMITSTSDGGAVGSLCLRPA